MSEEDYKVLTKRQPAYLAVGVEIAAVVVEDMIPLNYVVVKKLVVQIA